MRSSNFIFKPKKGFSQSPIKSYNSQNNYSYSTKNYSNKSSFWKIAALFLISIFWITGLSAFWWYYFSIYKNLPDIKTIDNIAFSQKSTILSKYWDVLYTIYEENRKEVSFDKISPNMINAIVAAEDQRFWTNPWVDFKWLFRVAVNEVRNVWPGWWASTLTQQVIKNLLLNNEKTIDRKLKEMTLAFQLNEYLREKISKTWKYSSAELDRKVKERILEMYLNYVFFWNNNYWVEIASQAYFWVNAKDLSPMQAAILASIPQAPGKYDPYSKKWFLAWELIISNWEETFPVTSWNKATIDKKLETLLEGNIRKWVKSDDTLSQLDKLKNISIKLWEDDVKITYNRWRKDYVLARMLEDWYIDEKQFIQGIKDTTDLKFKRLTQEMIAPHFVNYVLEQLRNDPNVWEEKLRKWWLVIKTTLDKNMQDVAEKAIAENMKSIRSKGWNNSAFVMVDSKNWDILAYVWSADFYNTEIDWETDILSYGLWRQPGSTMKPFMYAYNIWKNWITRDSPIFDIPLKIWNNTPENVDGQFPWYMPIRLALAQSRNIPAIVMYYLAGQDEKLIPYLKKLWMHSLKDNGDYWYPLAIWAWEVKPIELANAYMHLSAMWSPAKINPIQEIKTLNWNILYQKKVEYQEKVLPYWVAYIIWDILSNNDNLPAGWRSTHIINWLKVARKSWTTNIVTARWVKLPRDWWFAAYTPSKVWIFWAWNTDGSPMKADAYWGWLNSEAYQTIYKQFLAKGFIKSENVEPQEVKNISIDQYCWTLNGWGKKIPTIAYINSLPPSPAWGCYAQVKVDKLCNWKVTQATPPSDIITINVPKSNPLYNSLSMIKYPEKIASTLGGTIGGNSYNPTKVCSRSNEGSIRITFTQPWSLNVPKNFSVGYTVWSTSALKSVSLSVGWAVVSTLDWWWQTSISDTRNVSISSDSTITVSATDVNWYTTQKSISVNLSDGSNWWISNGDWTPAPVITDKTAPVFAWKKVTNNWDVFVVRLLFSDKGWKVAGWTISQDWKVLSTFSQATVSIKTTSQSPLNFSVKDTAWNIANWTVSIK